MRIIKFFVLFFIILTNQNFLFGYGTQADRFLIDQTASNALLYAYSSAGIFGLLSILFIYLRYFYIFLKSIKVY
jgi:O-antigen ligase